MSEIDIYFKFMVAVLKADGKVEQEERDFIVNSANALGLTKDFVEDLENHMLNGEVDLASLYQEIKSNSDASFTINLLRDSYALAKADGAIDDKELDILKGMMKTFTNYSDSLFDELIDWCEESLFIKQMGSNLIAKVMEEK